MRGILRFGGVALFLAASAVAISPSAFADRLKLKDGTVVEGTVIPRPDGYWVKSADGSTRTVAKADVVTYDKGDAAKPGVANPGAAAPTSRPAANLPFSATRAKANVVENALAAVTIWQQFVDNNPTSPDLPTAKQELAKWKQLADSGAEKIKGKWVGGDERQAVLEKAEGLEKEARQMIQSGQTIQAVKKLEEAANVYPNSFETNFTLGFLAAVQHNEPKANEWFNQALRIQPDCPEVLANLGILLLVKKQPQFDKGISLLRKALEQGDRKEIVQNLVTAVSLAPPAMQQHNKEMKESMEMARLLASKYGIGGPAQSYLIIPPPNRDASGKKAGGKGGDDKASAGPAGMWSGTGFLVSADGLILTNRHVVDGGKTLLVVLQDRTQKSAEVVVIDTEQDLALVRIKTDGKALPFVHLAPLDAPADGAECTVMGYPLIDRLGASIKITRGIVSSGASGGKRLAGPDVVIDAKVNPGNSGGPILDRFGNVMAIVSMKTVASALEDTYGLGISAGRVRTFLAKNKITVAPGVSTGAPLSAEEIAAKVKPAAVCILATR